MRISILAQCAVWAVLACSRVAIADTTVFINEIHYDNAGADLNEGVEIAGPAGTVLTGWQVVPYNGSGGINYSAHLLSGAIPGNCGGYGVVSVPISGLQNGGQNGEPDGVALVDNNGTVVQLLSYEGTFAATDGPAIGITTTDIGVMEDGNGLAANSLQLSGTGTQYSDFTWQADAASTFGACNNNQTFGTPPDLPPAVSSTVPAGSANNVALDATITINFSEAVIITPTAVDITCANSGSHTSSIIGSGSSYVVDPDPDFSYGESCTVTIAADQVTDLDGTTQDPMAANYSFSFSTTAGDVPPTVASTAPAAGATGFPDGANLQVTFSEPVTLDNGWFTLTCDSSGNHTGVLGGSGDSYSLNPVVDFDPIESCTWTIIASHVHDIDGTPDAMSADVMVTFDTAADAGDYYAGVDTSTGPALEAWLHNRIKDHTAYPYSGSGTVTWTILHAADEDPANSNNIVTIYKNASHPKTDGSSIVNREHTWPNSYGFNDITDVGGKPYPPYTDCHMLFLSDDHYNSDRANKPYGMCTGTCTEETTVSTNGFGGATPPRGNSNYTSASIWEPWDHRKGDLARAILYMAVRYDGGTNANGQAEPDLRVTDNSSLIQTTPSGVTQSVAYMGMETDLLNWSDQDPPDDGERLRNEVVYSYQENRNPFVDHPEWVRCVFTNTNCPVPADEIFVNGFEP